MQHWTDLVLEPPPSSRTAGLSDRRRCHTTARTPAQVDHYTHLMNTCTMTALYHYYSQNTCTGGPLHTHVMNTCTMTAL